jgi:hypothetical protein
MRELSLMHCSFFAAGWGAVTLVAVGCGGNEFFAGTGDAGVASTVTADQACGDSAHLHCERLQACSQSVVIGTYGDEGTCETRLKLNCLNSLAAPGVNSTPATVEACAKTYPTASCGALLDDQPAAACVQNKGDRANGQACGFPAQCQSGFCAIVPGSPCGACAPVPQVGESCAESTTCGQLLFCDSTTLDCTGYSALNGPCNRGQPCGAGLSCVGSTSATNGACQTAVETLGAPCDPATKTGPGCDRNQLLTCNSGSKECAAIQLAGAGAPCGTVNLQLAICANAGACVAADGGAGDGGTTIDTCVAPAADGDPCDLVAGPTCLSPARCVLTTPSATAGVCEFPSSSQCH